MPCAHQGTVLDKEAMLCGILRALEAKGLYDRVMADYDEVEAGVTRIDFENWWRLHKRMDEHAVQSRRTP